MFISKLILEDVKLRSRARVELDLWLGDVLCSTHFDDTNSCKALTLLVLRWSSCVVLKVG